jgi:predicted TIM-barrel fold metal-dependent hydrolase
MPIDEKTASYKGPPGSCDCHMHVFGDPVGYPYAADRRNSPPADPLEKFLEDYLALARRLGIERMVFVQPSTYGRDNSCMVDAMKQLGSNVRGIVDIDGSTSEAELDRLQQVGVRGVRINAGPPNRPIDATLMSKVLPRLIRMDSICSEIGWQLDLLGPYWLYDEMHDTLKALKSSFTVAHFGMFRGRSGADSLGFKRFLDLLNHGERRCWVKLTAPYRIGSPPLYEDAVPIARALIKAAPDRVIWGSDYPFLSHADRVSAVGLFNLIPTWAPDESARKKLLVDNPQKLFGF